jgi:LemA protein
MWWIIFVALAFFAIATYNRLVRLRMRALEAWSDIEVQLKRRYNLIPNLVDTVKGYAGHEEKVFTKVTEARAAAMGAESVDAQAQAENQLAGALKSLFAVAENYPQLRASENFMGLQNELTDTENKVQAARRFYNGNVRDLNTSIETFPTNIVASLFGFKKMDFFDLDEEPEARKVPKTDFSDKDKKEEKGSKE